MRILLLHPEDTPWRGEWSRHKWDVIVDLAFASPFTYDDWSRRTGARIFSIHRFAAETQSLRWVNQVFERGRGRLFDRMGLDWWEILSLECYQPLRLIYFLEKLRPELSSPGTELFATRPHLFAQLAEKSLKRVIPAFHSGRIGPAQQAVRMLHSAKNLRPAQIAEIALDKWDAGYRLRRRTMRGKRANLAQPAMLLPSAYSNVTRSVLAYAEQLPHRRFLLATTRRNAGANRLPRNVVSASIAAYVQPGDVFAAELRELQEVWKSFAAAMTAEDEAFRAAASVSLWDYFPAHLHTGLLLREAWKHLMTSEPITGILCGDDLNYQTRLPLILASRMGLNAVYCSHGALDGGFLFKQPTADIHIVKGEMECDYLQRVSKIEPDSILIGAPRNITEQRVPGDAVVFFSQPWEIESGRMEEIYREIIPPLYAAAQRGGRKLVIKLHPFESVRARKKLITSILPEAAAQIEIVSGVPPEKVMSRAWCGVTVDSSVAVECAIRGIPFFLCGWIDASGMGYLQQYARFNVARVLDSPASLERIPEMLADHKYDSAIVQRLCQPVDAAKLDRVMFGTREVRSPVAGLR